METDFKAEFTGEVSSSQSEIPCIGGMKTDCVCMVPFYVTRFTVINVPK